MVKLYKIKSIISSKLEYYVLQTIEETGDDRVKYIFKISFYDKINKERSYKNIYIDNISKNNQYSGTDVVNFIIKFLQSLKQIQNIYLHDGTYVNCKDSNNEIDLSLYKLLTSNQSYYQKFGFRLVSEKGEYINKDLINIAKKVSKYKVNNILHNFNRIIKFIEKYKTNIHIKVVNDNIIENRYNFNISNFILYIGYLYFALSPYKNYTFGECIKKMNDKKCFMLAKVFDIFRFEYLDIIEFKHDKNIIKSPFLYDFNILLIYRRNYNWTGMYMKKI